MWSGGITPHILVALHEVINKLQVPFTLQSEKHSRAQKRNIFALPRIQISFVTNLTVNLDQSRQTYGRREDFLGTRLH